MIIGVVSDTHRNKHAVDLAAARLKNCDWIFHLGDNIEDGKELSKKFPKKVVYIKGNCDFSVTVPSEKIIQLEGKNIFLTHGHNYGVKEGLNRLFFKAKEANFDLVLYGHTHCSLVEFKEGIFFVNPGSPALPRGGIPTIAVVEITDNLIVPTIIRL